MSIYHMRHRGLTSPRIIAVMMLLWLIHTLSPLEVQAGFEQPGQLQAADLLKPEILKGPHHSVEERVENDGLFNRYTVNSTFGPFTADSSSALLILVREINAIAAMRQVETDDTAIASLKKSGANTAEGIKNLFTDTEDTLKGAAAGVSSLFNRAKKTIGNREISDAEDSKVEQLIGYSKAKGQIASQFGVNVYSQNQVLQKELDRLAWADYLGGLGVGLATSVIPGVGGVVLTTSGTARLLNEAINTTPASELWVRNKEKLLAMGVDEDTVTLFLNNPVFSPALTTILVASLEAMEGVGHRDLLVKVALQASDYQMAKIITSIAMMTAGYHKQIGPLKRLHPLARITRAEKQDGAIVVVFPADHIIWSDRVAGAVTELSERTQSPDHGSSQKEIWTLGDFSPMAAENLANLGYQLHSQAGDKLFPKDEQ